MAAGGASTSTSTSSSDWIDWARLALGAYSSLKKPEYKQTPLSPEQRQLYQLYLNSLMNPALKDNAAKVSTGADKILGGYGNVTWNSPKTFSGEYGYRGNGGGFGSGSSPNPNAIPPPPADKRGNGPANFVGNGGLGAHIMNRTWDPADSSGGPEWGTSIYDAYTRNPGARYGEESFPTTGGPRDPNRPAKDGEKGLPGQAWTPGSTQTQYSAVDLTGFTDFLRSSGWKDAAKIALGFFGGGLTGAALAAARIAWEHYQNGKKGGP